MSVIGIFVAILLLAPVLRFVGRKVFEEPSLPLDDDPGPLVDSAPTTVGQEYALARMHTWVVVAAGLVLVPALGLLVVLPATFLLSEKLGLDARPYELPLAIGGYLVMAAGGVTWSLRSRASAARAAHRPFEVYRDRVRFPVASETLRVTVVTLPLGSIRSVMLLADGGLLIDATSETYALPGTAFVDPASPERLQAAIVAQLARLPAGAEILARAEEDAVALGAFAGRPALATATMMGLCTVGFAIELLVGFEDGALFRLGANVRSLTWNGDWYRLFTASFLHVGFWHILFNLSFISSVGGIVERALGPARFLVVYLFSGLVGAAMSSVVDFMSAGASTSAFGLLGSLAFLQSRRGDSLPRAVRLQPSRWLVLIGINAALPVLFPNISWAGHVGGLLGGVLACAFVAGNTETLASAEVPARVRHALGVLVASHLLAFGVAADHARSLEDHQGAHLEALDGDPGVTPLEELNNVAWTIAIDPKASPARLKRAVALAEQAAQTDHAEFQDTLAQALHRVGDADRAVRIEAEALKKTGTNLYATQLARFLRARLGRDKAPLIDAAAGDFASLRPSLGSDGQRVGVDVPVPITKPLLLHSLGRPLGLLELCLAAGPSGPRDSRVEGDAVPAGTTFELAYAAPSDCPVGRARFFAANDATVMGLP